MPSLTECSFDRKGFSLVELMVVIALIAIIAGFGTPLLLSMKAKSAVRADARDVYSTFRWAQSEAVKRSESIAIKFNSPSSGKYTVFLDNGGGNSTNANNAILDSGELIFSEKQLRPGSSFTGITFSGNPGYNARGLPLAGHFGSVEIKSEILTLKLSLTNAGFLKSINL